MKQLRFLVALAAVVALLAACGGGVTVVNVSINAQTTTIALNGRTQLSATVTGTSNKAVTWETSNPSVATVDANGIVEANGVTGTVDITATSVADVTKSDTVTLTVGSFSITSVTISAPSTTLQVGGTLQLSASVDPASAPQGIIWTSGSASVATISNSGKVTGVSVGTAVITAQSAADITVQAQVTLTVGSGGGGGTGTVTSVTITNRPSGDALLVGVTRDLDATVTGTGAFSQDVIWSSSAPSVATIKADGKVTGVAPGTTLIKAVAVSDTSRSDSFTLTVSQTSVDCSNPTVLSDINAETTLPVGCYSVPSGDTVNVSGALTLQAGTIIQFSQSSLLRIGFGGSLTANGSAGNPIIMRGENPTSGFWDGIDVQSLSAKNKLDYLQIFDAGADTYAGVYLRSTGGVAITHTTFSNSTIGLQAEDGGTITAFAANTFTGNDLVADIYPSQMSRLDGSSDYSGGGTNTDSYIHVEGGNSGSGTWPATNVPFRVMDGETLHVDDAVSVAPGAQVTFEANALLRIESTGTLNAVGTVSKRIGFSGTSNLSGYWDGIDVQSVTGNTFDYVDIANAGADAYAGIYLRATGGVGLSHTRISKSTIGLQAEDGGMISAFAANTFSGNDLVADIYPVQMGALDGATDYSDGGSNTGNYIQVEGGESGSGSWPATNVPFRVVDGGTLHVTGSVSVAPGAQLRFESNALLQVDSTGTFNAVGSAGSHITFNGSTASKGFWDGVDVQSNTANTFDYVDIVNGGGDGYANLYIENGGAATVHDSSFNNSSTYGIDLVSGSITPNNVADLTNASIGNNTFSGNTSGATHGIPAN